MDTEVIKSGYHCAHCGKEIDTTDEHVIIEGGTANIFCSPLHQFAYEVYVKPYMNMSF